MNLNWINPSIPTTSPPDESGWVSYWHGYFQMEKVQSSKSGKHSFSDPGSVTGNCHEEDEIEIQIILNLVNDAPVQHINMIELGAGAGEWCLALAGTIDNKLVESSAKSYRCVAVEPEPTHYEWSKEHFERQKINGVAVWGAVYNYNGECWLNNMDQKPEESYGQDIYAPSGNVDVPCYTLRTIMLQHNVNKIDILHMDIQRAEVDVIADCVDLFAAGLIRYVFIATHEKLFNAIIRKLLDEFIDFSIDIQPNSGIVETPFGPANFPVDGILFGSSKIQDPTLRKVDTIVGSQVKATPNDVLDIRVPLDSEIKKVMPFWQLEKSVRSLIKKDQELRACRLIRRWAAQRVNIPSNWNSNELTPDVQKNYKVGNEELQYYLVGYEKGTVATDYRDTSHFLAILYSYFGFSSAMLKVGIHGEKMSPVLTLVVIRHQNHEYTLIQDAYINAEHALEGIEVTTLGHYLVSLVTNPNGFCLADYHPNDRRSEISIGSSENEYGFRSVKMFDSLKWFNGETNASMREYISGSLNKSVSEVSLQDLFLFPCDWTVINDSERLQRESLYYEYQVPILRNLIVDPDQINEIDRTSLENSLNLL